MAGGERSSPGAGGLAAAAAALGRDRWWAARAAPPALGGGYPRPCPLRRGGGGSAAPAVSQLRGEREGSQPRVPLGLTALVLSLGIPVSGSATTVREIKHFPLVPGPCPSAQAGTPNRGPARPRIPRQRWWPEIPWADLEPRGQHCKLRWSGEMAAAKEPKLSYISQHTISQRLYFIYGFPLQSQHGLRIKGALRFDDSLFSLLS